MRMDKLTVNNSPSLRPICLLLLLAVVAHEGRVAEASCHRANLCCQGKNSTCRTGGRSLNNRKSATCFCDTDCLLQGDCCVDYEQACVWTNRVDIQVVDCVVGTVWSEWDECSVRCGYGTKQRKREVLVPPKNGGRACNNTVELKPCEGSFCKVARSLGQLEEIKETGKIVPAMFGTFRKNKLYDPYMDIRRNLFEHYKANNINKQSSYCANYRLTDVRDGCHAPSAGDWAQRLQRGTVVCAECQPTAMKERLGGRCQGQGLLEKETRWSATTSPGCHGRWIMESSQTKCQCNPNSELSFILV